MTVRPGLLALVAALLAGCPTEGVKPPPPAPPIDECEGLPPLVASADPTAVRVNTPSMLSATGGSARYTYTLAAGGSGAEIRVDRYIAGPTPGTDTVTAADDCGHSATVTIQVRAAFAVAPTRATIKPGVSFQVATSGTIGTAVFTAMQLGSGGTVSATGLYTAGTTTGLDLVLVRDSGTGEQALLQYQVSPQAAFRAAPAKLALPAGASVPLEVADGSGQVTWKKLMGPGTVVGSTFTAEAAASGLTLLEGTDDFTHETAPLAIRVLDELRRAGRPHGRVTDVAAIATADFDGDGVMDVAVGVPESDLARPQGGAVFIFKGAATGLPSAPTWTITGTTDTSNLGAALAAGDLDGDGKAELVVSEPGADVTVTDSGAVRIYHFTADGPRPLRDVLTGVGSGRFGAAMAVADVDGDGDNDLVVTSPNGDLAATGAVNGRGVLDVFILQKGSTIPDLGVIRLGGVDLAGDGTFKTTTQLHYGRALAVGDLNGDGRADLAWLGTTGAPQGDGGTRAQNAIAVHFGRDAARPFLDRPDAYVFPANPSDGDEGTLRLGIVPASDGKPARLLVTLERADSPNLTAMGGTAGGANAGAAYLFDLSALKPTSATPAAMPTLIQRTDAFARLYGDSGSIQAGRSFAVANVDGQPGLELILGAPYASPPGSGTSTVSLGGKLLVYPLGALTAGTVANKPADFRGGANRADVLGTAVAPWTTGSGGVGLVALSHRASTSLGDFTGRVDGFFGQGPLQGWSSSSVEVPAKLASEQFGFSIQLGAIAGKLRALVGAPGFSGPDQNGFGNDIQVGQSVVYEVGATQRSAVVLEGSSGSYTPDGGRPRFGGRAVGYDVAITDFDGDGRGDLVVAAPGFVTPSPTSPEYAPFAADAGCTPTTAVGLGGAVVHLGQADGTFKEGFRVWAPPAIAGCTGTPAQCTRAGIGRTGLAGGFDFNHDGKQDLALTRSNGLEIVLGRAPQDGSLARLTMACDPTFSLPALVQGTYGPVALGDLDGDGCDEVAVRYGTVNTAAAEPLTPNGIVIVFGSDPGGACGPGHLQSVAVRISGEPEVGLNSMQLGWGVTRAGRVLGDGRDFVAVSARLYPYLGTAQPTVLLFEVAQLLAKRPTTGTALVGAVGDGLTPIPVVYKERAPQLGRALIGNVDLTGDGIVDLVASAPGANLNGDGTGAIFVFAGGPGLQGPRESVLTVVADGAERANFGQDLSFSPTAGAVKAALGIGAPLSDRTGTANGTAFVLPLDFENP